MFVRCHLFVWTQPRIVVIAILYYKLVTETAPEELTETPVDSGMTLSGLNMKPSASEYVPKDITAPKAEQAQELQTFDTEESGLVNEDAGLTITAENRLLAATAFEQMGIDPRFIRAL